MNIKSIFSKIWMKFKIVLSPIDWFLPDFWTKFYLLFNGFSKKNFFKKVFYQKVTIMYYSTRNRIFESQHVQKSFNKCSLIQSWKLHSLVTSENRFSSNLINVLKEKFQIIYFGKFKFVKHVIGFNWNSSLMWTLITM